MKIQTFHTLKTSPCLALKSVKERCIWFPIWNRFPTMGHGVGPGGEGNAVRSRWESSFTLKGELRLFWTLMAMRPRAMRNRTTVTLDKDAERLSAMGRVPDSMVATPVQEKGRRLKFACLWSLSVKWAIQDLVTRQKGRKQGTRGKQKMKGKPTVEEGGNFRQCHVFVLIEQIQHTTILCSYT